MQLELPMLMTLFKVNPALLAKAVGAPQLVWPRPDYHYLAYQQGKSAVRVSGDVLPEGAHRFVARGRALSTMAATRSVVLHYPYSTFDRYWAKHARMGRFATDRLLSWKWWPPAIMRESQRFVVNDDRAGARAFFAANVMMNDAREKRALYAAGWLTRIEEVADALLAQVAAPSARTG